MSFIPTADSQFHPIHEPKALVQMASFPSGHHPTVRPTPLTFSISIKCIQLRQKEPHTMNFLVLIDTTAYSQAAVPITQQSSQCSSSGQINQISNASLGLFLLFIVICFLCIGRWHHKQQTATKLQQIQTLERIWKMTAKQET